MSTFFDSALFTWVVLPGLIFCARICDMSLDTMRIIMIGNGRKGLAALIGFFEVSIWLLVARQVIVHLPNPLCFFAYAGGFAAGNYVGMWIDERLASGVQLVRVIVSRDAARITDELKRGGYGFTLFDGEGSEGKVNMIFTIVDRRHVNAVIQAVERAELKAFYTIEDVRHVSEGVFPKKRERGILSLFTRK